MKTIGSIGFKTSRTALQLSLGVLIIASVACSHKSQKETAAPQPVSTPAPAANQAAAPSAAAAPAAKASLPSITCIHGTDSRELAIEPKGAGCNANYTKYGKTSSVATGTNGLDHCQKVVDKIRGKLESSGYTCK